jgi:molecular chaperone DnaK
MKRRLVGIDLGTTYSSVAYLDETGHAQPLADAEGLNATPSVVFFDEEQEAIVGSEAVRRARDQPRRVVEHAKRYLGESDGWIIDDTRYSPVDISAFILRKLKADAERMIGPVDGAVITVPAHFDAHKRQLTIEAAEQAGLNVLDIVNEPVAAALCYVLGEEGMHYSALADEQTILIYDLGGGTFDLSLVAYSAEEVRVLAASGDLRLGGIDWDERIADYIAEVFEQKHQLDLAADESLKRRLAREAELAKRALSVPGRTSITANLGFRGRRARITITRSQFEEMTRDLLDRTEHLIQQLLRAAGYHWHRLNRTIPVGGSSRMPMVPELIRRISLGISKTGVHGEVVYPIPPELSVAHGAALYAGIVASQSGGGAKGRLERLAKMRVVNVNSRSLGLFVRDGNIRLVNHIVIPRNTPLPAGSRVTVGTTRPGQRRVTLRVVQGETESASDADLLCECVIDDLPPELPEGSLVDVSLSYEENGLLLVVATHRATGLLASVSVKPL